MKNLDGKSPEIYGGRTLQGLMAARYGEKEETLSRRETWRRQNAWIHRFAILYYRETGHFFNFMADDEFFNWLHMAKSTGGWTVPAGELVDFIAAQPLESIWVTEFGSNWSTTISGIDYLEFFLNLQECCRQADLATAARRCNGAIAWDGDSTWCGIAIPRKFELTIIQVPFEESSQISLEL